MQRRLFNTLDMKVSVSHIVFISALTYLMNYSRSPSHRFLREPKLSIKDFKLSRLKQFEVSLEKAASHLLFPLLAEEFLVTFLLSSLSKHKRIKKPDIIINQLRIANILQKEGQNKKEPNNKDLLKCFYICSVNNFVNIFHKPKINQRQA